MIYQYYLVKCIIFICIFTATTTDESCSCPHYRGYTANFIPIPEVLTWLSPFPREYRRYCPDYRGNYRGIIAVPIPMSLFSVYYAVQLQEVLAGRLCALECGPDKPCHADTCCYRTKRPSSTNNTQINVVNVDAHQPSSKNSSSVASIHIKRRKSRRRSQRRSSSAPLDTGNANARHSNFFINIRGKFGRYTGHNRRTDDTVKVCSNGTAKTAADSTV